MAGAVLPNGRLRPRKGNGRFVKINKGKPGRPTRYSKEIALQILERVSQGETIFKICSSEDLPSYSTVRRWIEDDCHGFQKPFELAQSRQRAAWADQVIDIADGPPPEEDSARQVNRDRLRTDRRIWMLERLERAKYGPQVGVTHSGDVSININLGGPQISDDVIDVTPEEND